jgi:hypothetical protein
VRYFDALVAAVRGAGPTKLLFGSEGPLLQPALELQNIRLLGQSSRDESLCSVATSSGCWGGRRARRGSLYGGVTVR